MHAANEVFERVNRELLINLAGGRALLMELAHPLVAAGVVQHSQFEQRPLRRLWRTWLAMSRIIWGNAAMQRRALADFQKCHAAVHGRLARATGPCAAGATYHAHDAELKLWVLTTLIDSALVAYEALIAPLSLQEKWQYYAASREVATRFGIPAQVLPRDFHAFEVYKNSMLSPGRLHVGEDAQRVVQALFTSRLLRPFVNVMRSFAVGLLPPSLRVQYGWHWQESDEAGLQRKLARLRWLRAHLPQALCCNPYAGVSAARGNRTVVVELR